MYLLLHDTALVYMSVVRNTIVLYILCVCIMHLISSCMVVGTSVSAVLSTVLQYSSYFYSMRPIPVWMWVPSQSLGRMCYSVFEVQQLLFQDP